MSKPGGAPAPQYLSSTPSSSGPAINSYAQNLNSTPPGGKFPAGSAVQTPGSKFGGQPQANTGWGTDASGQTVNAPGFNMPTQPAAASTTPTTSTAPATPAATASDPNNPFANYRGAGMPAPEANNPSLNFMAQFGVTDKDQARQLMMQAESDPATAAKIGAAYESMTPEQQFAAVNGGVGANLVHSMVSAPGSGINTAQMGSFINSNDYLNPGNSNWNGVQGQQGIQAFTGQGTPGAGNAAGWTPTTPAPTGTVQSPQTNTTTGPFGIPVNQLAPPGTTPPPAVPPTRTTNS
jgi:hypothetical protein